MYSQVPLVSQMQEDIPVYSVSSIYTDYVTQISFEILIWNKMLPKRHNCSFLFDYSLQMYICALHSPSPPRVNSSGCWIPFIIVNIFLSLFARVLTSYNQPLILAVAFHYKTLFSHVVNAPILRSTFSFSWRISNDRTWRNYRSQWHQSKNRQ